MCVHAMRPCDLRTAHSNAPARPAKQHTHPCPCRGAPSEQPASEAAVQWTAPHLQLVMPAGSWSRYRSSLSCGCSSGCAGAASGASSAFVGSPGGASPSGCCWSAWSAPASFCSPGRSGLSSPASAGAAVASGAAAAASGALGAACSAGAAAEAAASASGCVSCAASWSVARRCSGGSSACAPASSAASVLLAALQPEAGVAGRARDVVCVWVSPHKDGDGGPCGRSTRCTPGMRDPPERLTACFQQLLCWRSFLEADEQRGCSCEGERSLRWRRGAPEAPAPHEMHAHHH
jgi:hypothetical protein